MLCIKDKCLEQKTRRVYISRAVVVDEQLFPFEDLRENTGAKLRQEISLISPALLPSYNMFQGSKFRCHRGKVCNKEKKEFKSRRVHLAFLLVIMS
jgi:hypothetical protein